MITYGVFKQNPGKYMNEGDKLQFIGRYIDHYAIAVDKEHVVHIVETNEVRKDRADELLYVNGALPSDYGDSNMVVVYSPESQTERYLCKCRALSRVRSHAEYGLLTFNCEHFANGCFYGTKENFVCSQVEKYASLAGQAVGGSKIAAGTICKSPNCVAKGVACVCAGPLYGHFAKRGKWDYFLQIRDTEMENRLRKEHGLTLL